MVLFRPVINAFHASNIADGDFGFSEMTLTSHSIYNLHNWRPKLSYVDLDRLRRVKPAIMSRLDKEEVIHRIPRGQQAQDLFGINPYQPK